MKAETLSLPCAFAMVTAKLGLWVRTVLVVSHRLKVKDPKSPDLG